MSESNHSSDHNPFWEFSLDFYGREGVADACLALQDEFSADVNIVLYCCWLAHAYAQNLDSAELAEIIAVIEPWQSGVVQRLRQIRQDMKEDQATNFGALSETLRQAIKDCELEGERIEQTILYQSGQVDSGVTLSHDEIETENRIHIAEANMVNYLERRIGEIPETGKKYIISIARALAS